MRTYGKLLAGALALSALPLVYACGGIDDPPETLSPAYAKIAVGQVVQFSAGEEGQVLWESRDPEVAEVSGNGRVTGLQPGRAIISGTCERQCRTALVEVINYAPWPPDRDPKTGGK